jgi:hypothetical protein
MVQIRIGLELLSSHFNIIISAQINTAQSGLSDFFYSLFDTVSEKN